jgi:uncharacterized membrane protein YhaH (DUF805 family)
MTLIEATKTGFKKYIVFSGRASRQEYWKFILGILIVSILIVIVHGMAFGPTVREVVKTTVASDGTTTTLRGLRGEYNGGLPGSLFGLFCLIPALAIAARRLHDTNRSAWWLTAPVIATVVGVVAGILIEVGPSAALAALRATGNVNVQVGSGLGILVMLLIFASWITLLVWLCQRSTPTPNRYGPNPLEVTP